LFQIILRNNHAFGFSLGEFVDWLFSYLPGLMLGSPPTANKLNMKVNQIIKADSYRIFYSHFIKVSEYHLFFPGAINMKVLFWIPFPE